jgi:serine/threonine-protein kinase RsbW
MVKNSKDNYKLSVSSDTTNLELIREFVSKIARRTELNSERINEVEMAVDEACCNVIEHAYQNNAQKTLTIEIKIKEKEKQFIVDIIDRSDKEFDPSEVKKVDLKKFIKERRKGGLGVHLIKNLMDDVHYFSGANKYNRVRLIKNIL